MIPILVESINYVLGRRSTFHDKLNQTLGSGVIPPHLEGSVARCIISPCRRWLTKLHHPGVGGHMNHTAAAFRSGGLWLEAIVPGARHAMAGMAEACMHELDAQREFTHQETFCRIVDDCGFGVRIPRPLNVLPGKNGLTMEYLGDSAIRFCDCTDDAQRARAVVSVSRLFFYALARHGLVHGDISGTNVMIDGNGTPCLVDYGCCFIASDDGASLLQVHGSIEKDPTEMKQDTEFIIQLWETRSWRDGWVERLHSVNVTSVKMGNSRASIPGVAIVLRSIMALTLMAAAVSPAAMRHAECEWKAKFPALVTTREKEHANCEMYKQQEE